MGNAKVTTGVITLNDNRSFPDVNNMSGFIRFTSTRYLATGVGSVDIEIERYGGNTGALSGTITQQDANRSSGKYTPISIPVSFADGEIGIKTYQFNVTTPPTDGPYWINLLLNIGPANPRHWWDINSEIEVNDGVSVPTIDTTNYFTVGPSGDFTTLVDACSNVQAPALIFVRGGTYANESTQGDGQGINPRYVGDRQNRIILAGYPGESVVIDADSSITDMTTQIPNNNAFTFLASRTQGNVPVGGWVIKGFTIKNAGIGWYTTAASTTDYHQYNAIEDCLIEDCGGAAGTNPAGVRLDSARFSVCRNTTINRVYEGNSLHLTEHDNNACVHGYKGCDIVIEDNTLGNASHCIYHKEPPFTEINEKGYIIRRNEFKESSVAIRTEDNYSGQDVTQSFNDMDIYHNICTYSTLIGIPNRGTFYSSSGLWIYNNNCPFNVWGLDTYRDIQFYNNLVSSVDDGFNMQRFDDWVNPYDNPYNPRDSDTWPTPGNADSTNVHEAGSIEYFDYNLYTPDFKFIMARDSATQEQTITTLEQWRTTTDPVILPQAIAGQNSQIFDPVYDANFRATVPLPSGRFGLVIGVPDSVSVGSNI